MSGRPGRDAAGADRIEHVVRRCQPLDQVVVDRAQIGSLTPGAPSVRVRDRVAAPVSAMLAADAEAAKGGGTAGAMTSDTHADGSADGCG